MAFTGHCHIIATGSCITRTRARGNLAEIDENLMRNELHYIDRGQAFKRRDELLIAYGKRATVGRPVNSPESGHLKTTSEMAKDMGVSKSKLLEEKQIATNILPEAQEAIKAADLLLQAGYPPACMRTFAVCMKYEITC